MNLHSLKPKILTPKLLSKIFIVLGLFTLLMALLIFIISHRIKAEISEKAQEYGLKISWQDFNWDLSRVQLHDVRILKAQDGTQDLDLASISDLEVKFSLSLNTSLFKINQFLVKNSKIEFINILSQFKNNEITSNDDESKGNIVRFDEKKIYHQLKNLLLMKENYEQISQELKQALNQNQNDKKISKLNIQKQKLKNQMIDELISFLEISEEEIAKLITDPRVLKLNQRKKMILNKMNIITEVLIENLELNLNPEWGPIKINGMLSNQNEHFGSIQFADLGFQWKLDQGLDLLEIFAIKEWKYIQDEFQLSLQSILINLQIPTLQLNHLKFLSISDLNFNTSLLISPSASIFTGKINIPHWDALKHPFKTKNKTQNQVSDAPIKTEAIQFPIDIEHLVPIEKISILKKISRYLSHSQHHIKLKNIEVKLPNQQVTAFLENIELKDSVLDFRLKTKGKNHLDHILESVENEIEEESAQQLKAQKKIPNDKYLTIKAREDHLQNLEKAKKKLLQSQLQQWIQNQNSENGLLAGHLKFSPKGLIEDGYLKWENLSISSLVDWKPLVNADLSGEIFLLPLWKSSSTDLSFENIWVSSQLNNGIVDQPITEYKVGGIDGQFQAWIEFTDFSLWQIKHWRAWREKLAFTGKLALEKQILQLEMMIEPTTCQNAFDSIPKGFWGLYQNAKLSKFDQIQYFEQMQKEKKKIWGTADRKEQQLSTIDQQAVDLLTHPDKLKKKSKKEPKEIKEDPKDLTLHFNPKLTMSISLDNAYSLKTQLKGFKSQCKVDALGSLMPKSKLILVDQKPASLADVDWIKQNFSFRMLPNIPNDTEVWVGPATGKENYTPLSQIPRYVGAAMYLTEEMNFWNGGAISPELITRGMRLNLNDGRFVYGGSTITQQLVKNIFLSRKKYLSRKLQEALISARIIDAVPKERVLELYLNCIEFGPSVYGITQASAYYFQKHPSQLRPREAIFLAMLKPYPLGGGTMKRKGITPSYPSWQDRYADVLDRLYKGQHISREQMEAEMKYDITWHEGIYDRPEIELPSYTEGTMYVPTEEEINALKLRLRHHQ